LGPGRLLVVGNPFFLARHRPLTLALGRRLASVKEAAIEEDSRAREAAYLARAFVTARLWPPTLEALRAARGRFRKEPATFARISRRAARTIAKSPDRDLVLQYFAMSSPAVEASPSAYAIYTDLTMAQARRSWPAWAPFDSERRYAAWTALESRTYRDAVRVFTFSEATRRSVIADYGTDPARVVTVGAAGNYDEASAGERPYGNRTLIFNGSEFERKGGDRALAAFRLVRARFPDARLTIVANPRIADEPGVLVAGRLGRAELFALFDATDVVLAPTRFDGFPGFVLEAMSRGVVAVLSDAEPMNEIVTDGCDGYVVSPPTPERLAERIVALFENEPLLREIGTAGRERVTRDWNWDAVAARMLDSLANGALP